MAAPASPTTRRWPSACARSAFTVSLQRYRHVVIGLNGRLDTLQAAVLLAKLPTFTEEVRLRQQVAARYATLIEGSNALRSAGVLAPIVEKDRTSVYAQYTVRVPRRDRVAVQMKAAGIPTAVHYPIPLHRQPVYEAAFAGRSWPLSEQAAAEVLSLPMHPFLGAEDQVRVVDALAAAVSEETASAAAGT